MSLAISVVVPAYGGVDLLRRNLPLILTELDAYREASGEPTELIVVDDGSPEPLHLELAEPFPHVRFLARSVNGGFAVAANEGVRAAQHPLVFLMNSDVSVHAGFLAPLVEELRAAGGLERFAVTPCVRLDGEVRRIESFVALDRDGGRVTLRQPGLDEAGSVPTEAVDVDFPLGGAMLVWRARFEELGGFDRSFAPFYLEDADLGLRARRFGWRTRYVPASVVDHHHRGTIGTHVTERCVRAAIERNRWLLTRAEDRARGSEGERRDWLPAALNALVSAARSGTLRDEATWLALGDVDQAP